MEVLNISEKNKVFVWTPMSTASRLAWKIFDNFEFSSYDVNNGGVLLKNGYEHNHYVGLFKNHENYKLILTCRNPYTMVTAGGRINSQQDLITHLERKYQSTHHLRFYNLLKNRKPDYFLRVENLLEDYLKIPFVRESNFYKSGKLEKLILENPYKSIVYHHKPIIDKKLADLVYYNNSYYFELLGYDKNSWKQ